MNSKRIRIFSLLGLLALGLVAVGAWQVRGHAAVPPTATDKQQYRCPMHPDLVQDHPGQCPICGMNLVPAGGAPGAGKPACEAGPSGGCCGGGDVPEPGK